MSIVIHGSVLSPFVRKVSLVATEKSISYEGNDISPFSPPANFEEISPLRRIPILEDDGFMLADSSAIVAYLEAKQAQPALLPSDAKELGYALWIEEYADTALATDIGLGVFRPAMIYPMMGKPVDHDAITKAMTTTLPPRFAYLNSQLEGKEWFAGEQFSIADISVYSQMMSLFHVNLLPDADVYPLLMAHFAKTKERPAAQTILQRDTAYLDAIKKAKGAAK